MTYDTFLQTTQIIFDSFPNEQVWVQGGLKPNRQLQTPEAGYCIVLRYDEKVTGVISQFMSKVHAVLPNLVKYDKQSLHTTIGTYGKNNIEEFAPDPALVQHISELLEKGIRGCSQNLTIEFGKWLYNEEAILVPAYPNQALWALCQSIGTAFQENGTPLEMGRIFHITTARFTSSVPMEEFDEFSSLMKSAPILELTEPVTIDLATWSCDGRIFSLVPHIRFAL